MTNEKYLVVPLMAAAMFANLFLFAVSYSNASFSGYERTLPSLGFNQLSDSVSGAVAVIGENLSWSVATAGSALKPAIASFLGLDDYKYGQPRYTVLRQQQVRAAEDAGTSQVLGISIVNPLFAQ